MVWFLWCLQIFRWYNVFCIIWWFWWYASRTKMLQFKINILRKITVMQIFWTGRSEGVVPNFAFDNVSVCGIFSSKVGILIFMRNIWCISSILVYGLHIILNSHMLGMLIITSSGGDHADMFMYMWHVAGWKSLIFMFLLTTSCHFVSFLVFIQFFKTYNIFLGKKYMQIMKSEKVHLTLF